MYFNRGFGGIPQIIANVTNTVVCVTFAYLAYLNRVVDFINTVDCVGCWKLGSKSTKVVFVPRLHSFQQMHRSIVGAFLNYIKHRNYAITNLKKGVGAWEKNTLIYLGISDF